MGEGSLEWMDRAPVDKADLLRELQKLTDEERMEIFTEFCRHCGCDDPLCQCENDE